MITIISGTANSITLRLNDNLVGTSSNFLFELESVQSHEKFYFIPADISTTTRFNSFDIFEASGTTHSNSLTASTPIITLSYGGSYNYTIYQTDNYTLATSSVILDQGKLLFENGEYITYAFNG